MQKLSVGFQIHALILVILRSSQTLYFFIIWKNNYLVEIEKDEGEFQEIAYTLSSLSTKRENIQMKKSFLKEPFRNDLHWINNFQSKKKTKQNQNKTIPKLAHLIHRGCTRLCVTRILRNEYHESIFDQNLVQAYPF